MEGGPLFNSGVLGSNFLWWIGQIADDSYWRDNIIPGKFPNKESIPGWGRRYKVRIMGVHDQGETAIPAENLPWANVMYPITAGSGIGNAFQTSALRQGMFVFGFWMDGQNMQTPVIMGVLGNNAQTPLPTGPIEENKVTNTQPGNLAYSGYADGKDPKTGTAKEKVPDSGLVTEKPKADDIAKEGAAPPPGVGLNKFGLRNDTPVSELQQRDIQNAQALAQAQGLNVEETGEFIKKKVQEGIKNRVGAANDPYVPPVPGVTMENIDAMHQLSAGDVKREDKYREKIVLMKPDDVVGSATKSIQIEIDNLTAKIDKYFNSLGSYVDAVSGAPTRSELDKEVGLTACKISKFMKIVMDKMMEYTSKSLNKELQLTVAEMPSSMRYLFGDQKFLNTMDTMKQYNEITDKMCGEMEGILQKSLGLDKAEEKIKKRISSGLNFTDSTSQEAIETIMLSIEKAGYKVGEEVTIAMDCASSEFYSNGKYDYRKFEGNSGEVRNSEEQVIYLKELLEKYPIDSIEDGCDENDWEGWKLLTNEIGNKCQLVGDDLFVTNIKYLKKGIREKSANSILIKPNQIGTLSETILAINLAKSAGWTTIISHRSGETEDTTISDIAVGLSVGQIKTGALSRSDRIAKYNQLLRIEEDLGINAKYLKN